MKANNKEIFKKLAKYRINIRDCFLQLSKIPHYTTLQKFTDRDNINVLGINVKKFLCWCCCLSEFDVNIWYCL